MNRPVLSTLLVLLMLAMAASACNQPGHQYGNGLPEDSTVVQPPAEQHLQLLFAGDLMQHMPQVDAARQADDSYDYDECFAAIRPEVEKADVAIVNFETTLAGPPYRGYPQFCSPDDFLKDVVETGFDVLLTANNHCADTYRRGMERTLNLMDSMGVQHLGTYRNAGERQQHYPFLLERNGLRVVLLNFTYDTNGVPVPDPCVVNLQDTLELAADLQQAKALQPDVIIALPHWGLEYQTIPSDEQQLLAQWLLDHGVDHIVGGHPHVAQPLELRDQGQHLVAWSMGNVVSNQTMPNTYGGYMVRMELTKRDSLTVLSDCGYTLYWVSRPHDCGRRHQYRILPIDYPDSLLTTTEQRKRATIRQNMRRLMLQQNKGDIKEYKLSAP